MNQNHIYCRLYDPNQFDYTRRKVPFNEKIPKMCGNDPNTFFHYKLNTRDILEQRVGYTPEQLIKKKEAFERMRA